MQTMLQVGAYAPGGIHSGHRDLINESGLVSIMHYIQRNIKIFHNTFYIVTAMDGGAWEKKTLDKSENRYHHVLRKCKGVV